MLDRALEATQSSLVQWLERNTFSASFLTDMMDISSWLPGITGLLFFTQMHSVVRELSVSPWVLELWPVCQKSTSDTHKINEIVPWNSQTQMGGCQFPSRFALVAERASLWLQWVLFAYTYIYNYNLKQNIDWTHWTALITYSNLSILVLRKRWDRNAKSKQITTNVCHTIQTSSMLSCRY